MSATGTTKWGQRQTLALCTLNLTVATAAYSAGQLVGQGGVLMFPDLVQQPRDEMLLWAAELSDASKQQVAFDLLLFDDNPVNTTFTDRATFALNNADLAKHIDTLQFLATTYAAASANAVAALRKVATPLLLVGTVLYGALVSRGAPTYAAGTDLTLKLWAFRP